MVIAVYFTKAQGTLMDPKIDPARLILGDPCRSKALQGPSKVQIDQFLLGSMLPQYMTLSAS